MAVHTALRRCIPYARALAGSFGQVFKSKLKSSGKPVAIKHVVGDNTAVREAAIFAMLAAHAHPNIIKLHGVRCHARVRPLVSAQSR